jgi:hypothetical protein
MLYCPHHQHLSETHSSRVFLTRTMLKQNQFESSSWSGYPSNNRAANTLVSASAAVRDDPGTARARID